MKLNQFIEGLKILQNHYKDGNDYCIKAEHDMFYAYRTDSVLTNEDVKKLYDFGFFRNQPMDPMIMILKRVGVLLFND